MHTQGRLGQLVCLLALFVAVVSDTHAQPRPGDVIYGVVPTLFGRQPFSDVTKRLDDLEQLGVDILWLSPINDTDDPSAISYAVTDYFRLRRDFGSEQELRQLVAEAHKRGIKVIMDFVPNHTSSGHRYFQEAVTQRERSPYFDYYDRDENDEFTYYFDWENLINLNYSNPDVVQMMIRAFKHWITKYGIDGYRADAAWGIKERAPKVWKKINRDLRSAHPEMLMLAEAGARDRYYYDNGFDLAYDWSDQLGVWAWKKALERPEKAGPYLRKAIAANPYPSKVVRFINNNDTGPRFITKHGPELMKVASTLAHTVPGIPVIYTGDEVGAEYEPYEDPAPISWEDKYGLKAHHKKLAQLRETRPALHSGEYQALDIDGSQSVFAFQRTHGTSNHALVILNFGKAAQVRIRVPQGWKQQQLQDLLSANTIDINVNEGWAEVNIPATTAWVLEPN